MAIKPEIKKEIKKDFKAADPRQKIHFAFGKKNYQFLVAGIVLLIIGYITLSGGGSNDPNQFSYELFSTRRMVVAPIILIIGYAIVAYGILVKESGTGNEVQEK